jgi:phenylacetate-CoA ligase
MTFYKFILTRLIVPLGDVLMGNVYIKTLKLWNKYDNLNREELNIIQEKNIQELLEYAIKNVPAYENQKYNPTISSYENLQNFPILTKEILRSERENLVSKEFKIEGLQKNFSSGSSGVQSYSYSEKKNKFMLQGIQNHWYMWSGYQLGDKILQFGISPNRTLPKKLKDVFYQTNYQNAFTLSEKGFKSIYKQILKSKTQYLIGYPSAINEFSKYLIKYNLQHPFKGVISLGDKLFPHFEKNFNRSFQNPKIIDTYGCAEGFLMACRADLPYYYIMSPHVHIEIVDEGGNLVPDGELGFVLVTCFTNLAQPFIRYKLGDLAIKLPENKYPKNRNFNYPLLEKIIGRETDIVKTPNGKTLIVHSFTGIFEYFPEIKQYKIIQNEIDQINIQYIIDEHFDFNENSLNQIEEKINVLTDKSLILNFIQVDFISSTKSGKPQIIESNLVEK